jgi:2-polyprenyl-6-methoxyphenol hydroxylase-like FAD-dependent oxidoreductase
MLYDLMLSKVPRRKLHLNKRVERTEEKDGKVIITFRDGSQAQGDILVGADGAYSTVRKSLYEKLDKERLLPKADLKGFDYACVNMVGVSEPQDPSIFPELKDEKCHFTNMTGDTGDRGVSWNVFKGYMLGKRSHALCWAFSHSN